MGHLVDADGHCQDDDIILAWFDFHTIDIPQSEPFLGNFGDFVAAFSNAVLVIENIAFHFQIRSIFNLDCEAVAHG